MLYLHCCLSYYNPKFLTKYFGFFNSCYCFKLKRIFFQYFTRKTQTSEGFLRHWKFSEILLSPTFRECFFVHLSGRWLSFSSLSTNTCFEHLSIPLFLLGKVHLIRVTQPLIRSLPPLIRNFSFGGA